MGLLSDLRSDDPSEMRRRRADRGVRMATFLFWWLAFGFIAVSIRFCVALLSGGILMEHGLPISHAEQWHAFLGFGCAGVLIGAIAYASRKYW